MHNKFGLQNYGGKNALDLISDIQIQLDNVNKLNYPILDATETGVLEDLLTGGHPETLKKIQATNDFVNKNNGSYYIVLPRK